MLDKLVYAAQKASFLGDDEATRCFVVSSPDMVQHIAHGVKKIGLEQIEAIADEGLRKNTLQYSGSFFWFGSAPALLAISCRKTPEKMKLLAKRNSDDLFGAKTQSAMAAQNVMLAATAMGLGTCCLTGPLVAKPWLEAELGCPADHEIVVLISIGFITKNRPSSQGIQPAASVCLE